MSLTAVFFFSHLASSLLPFRVSVHIPVTIAKQNWCVMTWSDCAKIKDRSKVLGSSLKQVISEMQPSCLNFLHWAFGPKYTSLSDKECMAVLVRTVAHLVTAWWTRSMLSDLQKLDPCNISQSPLPAGPSNVLFLLVCFSLSRLEKNLERCDSCCPWRAWFDWER